MNEDDWLFDLPVYEDQVFRVETDPDLWKAKEWAGSGVRVIETCVGAYGAIDQGNGTVYFDVGDVLVRVHDLRTVIVTNKGTIAKLTADNDN